MKRNEIEKRATQILRDHDLFNVPVDPLKVAKALDIKVMNAVFSEPNKSGAVVRRGQEYSIFLNTNEPPNRKRFTIAHEIGHQLLHMSPNEDTEFVDTEDNFRAAEVIDVATWDPDRRREWEANVFAGALLMNEALLREKWKIYKDPSYLSWMFQVSEAAMYVRLTQLGLLEELP
ncbi:MAG: ImmA/IrrE family metallo-endopeptidase [Syntrophales bacterium]|jgi:Zn-dependent peptidase ImmA (M78 family)|nr:ImmA/IrrE family metallo-endopeptidase [Syntrophales bacterium]